MSERPEIEAAARAIDPVAFGGTTFSYGYKAARQKAARAVAQAALAPSLARIERLENALRCFLEDERFQVAVGGNPNVVERMLDEARRALGGSSHD